MSSAGVLKSSLGKEQKKFIRRELWERSRICGICKKELPGIDKCSLDHIVPLSQGGIDGIENMQLAHFKCNHAKDNKLEHYMPKAKDKPKYTGQLINMISDELGRNGKKLVLYR